MSEPNNQPEAGQGIVIDPKYAPPYPQSFYRFWPKHALMAGLVSLVTLGGILWLALRIQIPTDSNMPPMPDAGAFIPGPEWYLFLLFQPFWYWTDKLVWLRPIGTFWLPLLLIVLLVALPFVYGKTRAANANPIKMTAKVVLVVLAWLIWGVGMGSVVASGGPAKTTGCISCHNPQMGSRQSLPPADMGKFYRENRQQQIDVGKYRIGDVDGVGGSYKDANWQLRHYYEPTMTW